jgi:hypothetical protein
MLFVVLIVMDQNLEDEMFISLYLLNKPMWQKNFKFSNKDLPDK